MHRAWIRQFSPLAELHNMWLSTDQYDGMISAAKLERTMFGETGTPLDFVVAIYDECRKKGYRPRGIVSNKTIRTSIGHEFALDVDGPRVYVGSKSKFYIF